MNDSMVKKFFHPKEIVGYDHTRSVEWNVTRGRNHKVHGHMQSYLTVGEQLHALADVNLGESRDAKKFTPSQREHFKTIANKWMAAEALSYRMHKLYGD